MLLLYFKHNCTISKSASKLRYFGKCLIFLTKKTLQLSVVNAGTPSPIRSVKSALIVNQELEFRAKNAEASLAELKKSVDELKKEKTEQEKVMEEKMEKLRGDYDEAR